MKMFESLLLTYAFSRLYEQRDKKDDEPPETSI